MNLPTHTPPPQKAGEDAIPEPRSKALRQSRTSMLVPHEGIRVLFAHHARSAPRSITQLFEDDAFDGEELPIAQLVKRLAEEGAGAVDLVVLDETPDLENLVGKVRAQNDRVGLLALLPEPSDRKIVELLNLGADEVLPRSLEVDVLRAHAHAVVRCHRSLPILSIGDLHIDLATRAVKRGAHRVELSPREFDLLRVLANARGRVLSRHELFDLVWESDFDPSTTVVEVLVNRLRSKLQKTGSPLIHTVLGQGYLLANKD